MAVFLRRLASSSEMQLACSAFGPFSEEARFSSCDALTGTWPGALQSRWLTLLILAPAETVPFRERVEEEEIMDGLALAGGWETWQPAALLLPRSRKQVCLYGGLAGAPGDCLRFRAKASGSAPPAAASLALEDLLALVKGNLLKDGEGVLAGSGEVMDWLPPMQSDWLQAAAAWGDPTA